MPVDPNLVALMALDHSPMDLQAWTAAGITVGAPRSPDPELLQVLDSNDVPWFAARRLIDCKLYTTSQLGNYRPTIEKFETTMELMFADYFDVTAADPGIQANAVLLRAALIASITGAHREASDRIRIDNEERKKQENNPDATPIMVSARIKEEAREKFKDDHDDLDLQDKDFLADAIWDIVHAMVLRKALEHLCIDLLRTLDEGIRYHNKKQMVEGYERMKAGHIEPRPPIKISEVKRRIRAWWFLCHHLTLAPWDQVGSIYMKKINEFMRLYKTDSIVTLIELDEVLRQEIVYKSRYERRKYATYQAAAIYVLTHQFDQLAAITYNTTQKGKRIDSTTPQRRNMIYAQPETDALKPKALLDAARLDTAASDDEGDTRPPPMKKQKPGKGGAQLDSGTQSMIDKAIHQTRLEMKGKVFGKGKRKGKRADLTVIKSMKRPKGLGKGRKGKRGPQGAAPALEDDAPRESRQVPMAEMTLLREALKTPKTPDRKYCFQFNSSIGCSKTNCFHHKCIKCDAEHALVLYH